MKIYTYVVDFVLSPKEKEKKERKAYILRALITDYCVLVSVHRLYTTPISCVTCGHA